MDTNFLFIIPLILGGILVLLFLNSHSSKDRPWERTKYHIHLTSKDIEDAIPLTAEEAKLNTEESHRKRLEKQLKEVFASINKYTELGQTEFSISSSSLDITNVNFLQHKGYKVERYNVVDSGGKHPHYKISW